MAVLRLEIKYVHEFEDNGTDPLPTQAQWDAYLAQEFPNGDEIVGQNFRDFFGASGPAPGPKVSGSWVEKTNPPATP